jgi:hypothetical protein
MVAYNFKERFIRPIRVGLSSVSLSFDCQPKRQTIRAHGKRRHARAGEELQLYYAQRTKQCQLIGKARCTRTREIEMVIRKRGFAVTVDGFPYINAAAEEFARMDGFADTADMLTFWNAEHPGVEHFVGVVIEWEPLT